MARTIYCKQCGDNSIKKTINRPLFLNELVGFRKGQAKGYYYCDLCNKMINEKDFCIAITTIPTQDISWMEDFVGV